MKIESRELPCGTDRSPTTPYFQLSTPNSQLSTILRGLVIKNTGSWYLVKTDEGTYVECKIKGNFRLKGIRSTNPVAVGDHVQIILNQEGTAFINEIEDRKNYIIRRSEDAQKGGEEKLQKIHDKYIKQIDDMLAAKDKEIMTV